MPTTLPTDMKFVDPFTQTGYIERITQVLDKFNGGSANTVVLRTVRKIGDFSYETFFKNAGGLVSRQDQTSVAPVASKKLVQGTLNDVKLNRKIGPVEWTRSALLKPGLDMNAIRYAAGVQAADDVLADMLNTGLLAGRAALGNVADLTMTVPTAGVLDTMNLAGAMAKLGDNAANIKAWVTHSKPFYDLVKAQINPTAHGDSLAGSVVMGGTPATFGKPVIVTDSPSLVDGTDYFTLGLTTESIVVEETEDMYLVVSDPITGLEQLVIRMQGEFAYNLGLKGFAFDVTAGKNPTLAAVGAGANWIKAFDSIKHLGGVVIKSK